MLCVELGSRIHCDGEYGTILYVGSIEGVEGTWVGVEWDDPTRGKHNGTYKNKIYFSTRLPNSGSFIKISKADFGISCVEAIRIKYGKGSDSADAPAFINLPQKSGIQKQVEVIGIEKILHKQSNYTNLTDIVLCGKLVNGAGRPNELHESTPNIRNLDLQENLLPSWNAVIEIVQQLPNLTTLVLSKNRLKLPDDTVENKCDCFHSLKTLILNDMAYSWNNILSCAAMWPSVKDLKALDNNIDILEQPVHPIFSQLTSLNLSNNPIRYWNEVCKLGKLTNLEELYIDDIKLENIQFSNTSPLEQTDLFLNLKILFARNNKLNLWKHVSELNKLSNLRKLMIMNNPVIETVTPETARQLIIAKIKGLEILHKTQIDRSERRGAEVDYLKRYHSEWVASGRPLITTTMNNLTTSFLEEHPTYINLLQNHGASEDYEIRVQSVLLKDNLISVQIFSPLVPDKPSLTRKLPVEMTVGKLKALVQRIFKVSAHEVSLTRIFKEDECQRTVMDNNLRELSFYSLSDQDKISVEW